MTLANVTISSGNVTITNVSVTTANVTTLNATTVIATTANVTTANITTGNVTNMTSGNVTITGGSINGTTLGATTASTANVTTLTTSSTVTINGGTANGVAYLNGSKVLTTGSALTFNGTSFGVGSSSYGDAGTISLSIGVAGSTAGGLQLWASSAQEHYIQWGDSTTGSGTYAGAISYSHVSDFMRFWVNSAEQMRLTSTGLGIGTSSPSQKLQLSASSPTLNLDSTNRTWWVGSIETGASDANFQVGTGLNRNSTLLTMTPPGNLGLGVTPSAWAVYKSFDSGSCSFNTAGVQGELTSNGFFNSSSAWIYKATGFANRYVQNLSATGVHAWFTAPSGTAGDTISFTQAMTLDASGNLLLGETSPVYGSRATISYNPSTHNGPIILSSSAFNTNNGAALWLGGKYDTAGNYRPFAGVLGLKENATDGNSAGYISFRTNGNAADPTERARITSAGDVGIGTSSPASKLSVVNASSVQIQASTGTIDFRVQSIDANSAAYAGTVSNHALVFTTNNFERARITSGGDLLVGTTSNASGSPKIAVNGSIQPLWGQFRVATVFDDSYRQGLYFDSTNRNMTVFSTTNDTGGNIIFSTRVGAGSSDADYGTERARITSGGYFKASNTGTYQSSTSTYHELRNDANANTVRISNTIASGYTDAVAQIAITGYSPNTTNSWFLFCNDSTATRAEIRSNGGIANYQGNDVNLSDRREKTNFAPAKSYLDTICAIPVQTFNYIDQSEDDPGLTLGVVAQDVQAVAPELVMESDWGTKDDPKMRLSIYQTDLQYALMKCIQELKAELDSVKAELATLKGK
jgi:hypothetical protein